MFGPGLYSSSSLLALCATLVVASASVSYANLISTLRQDNITVIAPGNAGYSTSSTACKSFDLFQPRYNFKLFHNITVNLRFTFKPAGITYPKNARDVSTIIKIAHEFSYSVVARSGGVRLLLSNTQVIYLKGFLA